VDLGEDKVPTRFTETQKSLLGDYKYHLSTTPMESEEDLNIFQRTLFSVLFRHEQAGIDKSGKLACPVQSFMALLALRSVGNFVGASLVTQPISRLMYSSRGAVLLHALDTAPKFENRRFLA
jgi:hypothetical protein